MTCPLCKDTGLTLTTGSVAICAEPACEYGSRLRRTLTAIARAEPVAIDSADGWQYDPRPCGIVGPMMARRRGDAT